ncbi:MAG: hypothetical protein OEY11_13715, partial [Gammaproteobacteria bacterium]|nr:hypothetical protein [Gammaproteobacteria bacterium]
HSPSLTLELDNYLKSTGRLPLLYPLIARENNFDLYSYEYEMMQAEPIIYSEPQGIVAEHIENGRLNLATFKTAWHEQHTLSQLQAMAKELLQIDDLTKTPELEQALKAAYTLGQKSISPDENDESPML